MLSKNVSTKTVVQKVRIKMLGEKASAKTTSKNDSTEMLPKNLSAKTVVQNVRTELLGKKASEKTTIKMTTLKCCPKLYPQEQLFKMSVLVL